MDIVMPQLGETVAEGTVTVWHKKPGERIDSGEILFEVETDKVDTEVPAPAPGVLGEILIGEGETVSVGTRLAVMQADGEEAPAAVAEVVETSQAAEQTAVAAPALASTAKGDAPPLSPVVRGLLAEHGLVAADIKGSGTDGRIKKADIKAHIAALTSAPLSEGADRIVVPFNKIRKRTAEHMVRSTATSPHVLQAVEVDFHRVAAARTALGTEWKTREGFSLTYLPFIARALCEAIAEFPHVNASVEGEALVVWRDVHLAIAVDLGPDGLVAPVIRDAQAMSVTELARAIDTIAAKARKDQLTANDLLGGTYTISNSGAFGTLITVPIINQPQVAILSTDGIAKKPVVVEGPDGDAIVIRPIGVLAQSFDHRAIDGAYSAAFLNGLKQIIENTDWLAACS